MRRLQLATPTSEEDRAVLVSLLAKTNPDRLEALRKRLDEKPSAIDALTVTKWVLVEEADANAPLLSQLKAAGKLLVAPWPTTSMTITLRHSLSMHAPTRPSPVA